MPVWIVSNVSKVLYTFVKRKKSLHIRQSDHVAVRGRSDRARAYWGSSSVVCGLVGQTDGEEAGRKWNRVTDVQKVRG